MYRLTTRNHNHYRIHDDGAIERMDGRNTPDASNWQMIGVRSTRGGLIIPLAEVPTIVREWTYKNGKPMFTVIDKDHGTLREWGDGIVRFVKEES